MTISRRNLLLLGTLGAAAYIRARQTPNLRDKSVSNTSLTDDSSFVSYASDMSYSQVFGRRGEVQNIFSDGAESDKCASELTRLVEINFKRSPGSCFCICRIGKVKEDAKVFRCVVLIYTRTEKSPFALVKSIDLTTNQPVDTVAYSVCLKMGASGNPLFDSKYLRTKDLQRIKDAFNLPLLIEGERYAHQLLAES